MVLQQQAIIRPDYAVNSAGYIEHVVLTMATAIGKHAFDKGLLIKHDEEVDDIITGRERVIRLAAGFIKPREDNDKK